MIEYNSVFAAEIKVDIANFLVENLLKSKLELWKKPLPRCPFWRKEYQSEYPQFKKLADSYALELTAIRDLLAVFAPAVILKELIDRKYTTVRFLTKEQKSLLLYSLFNQQVKLVRSLDIPIREFEEKDIKNISTGFTKTKLSL